MASPDLAALQSLVSELIRAPDGVARTVDADGGDRRRALEAAVCSDARLDAVHRIEVYANAYFYRILDCLAEDFGALRSALGEVAFHDLITAFLLAHPSNAFSMRHVGARLPEFLERGGGAAWARKRFPWAPPLARLEWSFMDAFDAEDRAVATRADYAGVAPEAFSELRFALDPSVQRLEIDGRAVRAQRAHEQGEALEAALEGAADPVPVLVWRKQERVRSRSLSPEEALALEALSQGASFGEICVRVSERLGEEAAPAAVAGWLAAWLDAGCLSQPDRT